MANNKIQVNRTSEMVYIVKFMFEKGIPFKVMPAATNTKFSDDGRGEYHIFLAAKTYWPDENTRQQLR